MRPNPTIEWRVLLMNDYDTIKSLEEALDSLSFWMRFWTALVVFGLIVEYVPEVLKLFKTRPFDRSLLRAVMGGILITVGVAGELYIEFRASSREDALRTANKTIIARLDREAADARTKQAEAEKELARLQLALRPRHLDHEKFLAELGGKPKARAKIWYVPNDSESFMLASQVYHWLGLGQGDGAAWDVSKPEPIPEQGGYAGLANAPGAVRFGPGLGVGVVANKLQLNDPFKNPTALSALTAALGVSLRTGITGLVEPSLPDDLFIVVVAQKP
jgi:hypothetical protein